MKLQKTLTLWFYDYGKLTAITIGIVLVMVVLLSPSTNLKAGVSVEPRTWKRGVRTKVRITVKTDHFMQSLSAQLLDAKGQLAYDLPAYTTSDVECSSPLYWLDRRFIWISPACAFEKNITLPTSLSPGRYILEMRLVIGPNLPSNQTRVPLGASEITVQ